MKTLKLRVTISALMVVCASVVAAVAQDPAGKTETQRAKESPPYWAFAVEPATNASDSTAKPRGETRRHVPGSAAIFTLAQIGDLFSAPDWHSSEHPVMPEIVARGRNPDVFACGYCHLPNGQGRPENASLAGLPATYIVEQMADLKSGQRRSSEPKQRPIAMMATVATKADENEIHAAAEYFSGLTPKPWIRVVETATVPKTHIAGWMLVLSAGGGRELIGHRIIEMAEDPEQTELRNDASGFAAYVPVGSIARGKELAGTGGGGKTLPCGICHGSDLKGKGGVPSIAGRSPSYIVRQLYDFQSGARTGVDTQLMKPTVANLTIDDMISIAAYTASLRP